MLRKNRDMKSKKGRGKWIILPLTAALLFTHVPSQPLAAHELDGQDSDRIQDAGLRKAVNKALNEKIENEESIQEESQSIPEESGTSEPETETTLIKKKESRSENQKVTKEELETLTVLNAAGQQIEDISGLEYAVNLETLDLDDNKIADISSLRNLERLKSFNAKGQSVSVEEKKVDETTLKIVNPIIGLDKQPVSEISGEKVRAEDDTIVFDDLKEGVSEREASFAKVYEKGSYSGTLTQKAVVFKTGDKAGAEEGKARSKRSLSPRGEQHIYEKHYRYSHVQDAYADVYWDPSTKRLRVKSRYSSAYNVSAAHLRAGLASERDKNFSVSHLCPPYTQVFTHLLANGAVDLNDYETFHRARGYTFQASTGSLLYVYNTQGNFYWNGSRRYDDRMGIAYTEPGAGDSDDFKVLADGTLRRDVDPSFLASEFTVPYLNTTFKVHENHMAVLGDNFLSTRGNVNKKIMIRLKNTSGAVSYEEMTQDGQSYYETFKDIQGFRFNDGEVLEITDFSGKRSTSYRYDRGRKEFRLIENNVALKDKYLIQLTSGSEDIGYDLLIDNGIIKSVRERGIGSIIHGGWTGSVYLSIGIFKANGDLRKAAMIQGGDHRISSTSEVSRLEGIRLEEGDEIILYAVKDRNWDETGRVRVLGKVNGGMSELDRFERKPGFNTKVFRYSASTMELSQVDGTITDMEPALKSTVEEKLRELTLNPEGNGDKKAWMMGLYLDETITFGSKNIQKLTGLEYAVNLTKLSVTNNPYKPETYRSLRNLQKLLWLYVGNIGLKGNEKTLVDTLVNLNALYFVNATSNKITDVKEFGRLRQIDQINLDKNHISDISPLTDWTATGTGKILSVNEQTITKPSARTADRDSYREQNTLIGIGNRTVKDMSDFNPADKGRYDSILDEVWWSRFDVGEWTGSYNFSGSGRFNNADVTFTGRVNQPLEVFESYLIKFEPNGGEISGRSLWYLEKGAAAGDLLEPNNLGLTHSGGYSFEGWYENDSGMGKKWEKDTPINNDLVLYADWKPPAGEYIIRLNGNGTAQKKGYDMLVKDGMIAYVRPRGGGEILHPSWSGKVYLSMGIYNSSGDLKKKAALLGGDHIISDTSEAAMLQGTVLEDGDEIVIYAVKDSSWDETTKVRIIGDVEGGMPQLSGTGKKPGFNNQVFRYNAATRMLSQVDGTIADMDGALKNTVEERLRDLSLKPEANGDKKAWMMGLYADTEIGFGRKEIQKLTGLEYAVNMKKVSVADNPLKTETYRSMRNLTQVSDLNIGNIGLKGNEKSMIDVLESLPALRNIYAGYNGITNVREFGRLRQLDTIQLEYNSISDISPLGDWTAISTDIPKTLDINDQMITKPLKQISFGETYQEQNTLIGIRNRAVSDISDIQPAGKGEYRPSQNEVWWSGLDAGKVTGNYAFSERGRFNEANINFNGRVNQPLEVFDTMKYRLTLRAHEGGSVRYTVDSETGTVTSDSPKEIEVHAGQSVRLEASSDIDYEFVSWSDGDVTADRTFVMPANDVVLRAGYKKKMNVTFDPNGGEWTDGSTGNKRLYLSQGEAVGPMMDETEFAMRHPSGYRLAGWYLRADGTGDAWDLKDPVNTDMTLYANWEYANDAVLLYEIPKEIDLKSTGKGEAAGSGSVKVVDGIDMNLIYKNVLIKATPDIQLKNPKTDEVYDVKVWKEDGSAYTDGSQPLMRLHPKGDALPKQGSFTLKTPNLYPKRKGKYQGNMVFNFSWE